MPSLHVLIAGLMLVSISGCLDEGIDGDSSDPGEGDACDFSYPDGSSVPCEDRSRAIDSANLPLDAVCLSMIQNADVELRTHYSPAGDRYFVTADVEHARDQQALIMSPDGRLHRWDWDEPVETTDLGDVVVLFYVLDVDPPLSNHLLWSEYEGQFWLVVRLGGDGDPTYVQPMAETMIRGEAFYHPESQDVDVNGTEYALVYRSIGSYGLSQGAAGLDCATTDAIGSRSRS